MTLNRRLVREAVQELKPIADRLGLTVGEVLPERSLLGKRDAYNADISVGMVSEYLFDALRSRQGFGRPIHQDRGGFRLIDEVDLVLLDEALTPHVLAAAGKGRKAPLADLAWSARVASVLEPEHYTVGRKGVQLTDTGLDVIRSMDDGRNLRSWRNRPLVRRVENALMYDLILKKDVHYIRDGDEIVIVDEHGQRLDGRRWNDGLQEAIEFAEGGPTMVGSPTRMFDSITIARLPRRPPVRRDDRHGRWRRGPGRVPRELPQERRRDPGPEREADRRDGQLPDRGAEVERRLR